MKSMNDRIIFFSGGIASLMVAALVKETYPEENTIFYSTDKHWESEELECQTI